MNPRDWIGRAETALDTATPTPCAQLAATLDWPDLRFPAGRELPPLWQWLFFLPLYRQSVLSPDGHVREGGFLPPIELPRRMWAGSQLEFHEPIRVGDELRRVSTIRDVSEKAGRSGPLVFVQVCHEVSRAQDEARLVTEWQDIVYRDAPRPGEAAAVPRPAPVTAAWTREIHADEVMLLRYSAVTFNGHRIHYDHPYATGTEGYPGLVVHGPLIATLLVDLLRRERPQAVVRNFRFRALRPTFHRHPFKVCGQPQDDGRTVELWGCDREGWVTMEATATLA